MKIIVISRPDFFEDEAAQINTLFGQGMQLLHLRKPNCSKEELASLLRDIHSVNYPLIALHQHHELAGEFGIKRLHFPEQLRLAQSARTLQNLKAQGFILSTSIHDAAALDSLSDAFSYSFFGPIFDSLSKPGYLTKLPPDFKLNKQTFPGEVIAIGGIDESRIQTILRMGFQGAALLSSIWQNPHQKNLNLIPGLKPGAMDFFSGANEFAAGNFAKGENSKVYCPGFQAGDRIRKEQFDDIHFSEKINQNQILEQIDSIQFISQENERISHIESIRLALEAGCRWIQLRVKNKPEEEVLQLAWEAIRLCDQYGARLIINDFPKVALAVEAYGLHLGLSDMSVQEARGLVGDKMVIGGTANTWEDIVLRVQEGCDYIGLGPFRFTATKQNLSPVLGLEGYSALMRKMFAAGYNTPVIAIGGITPADVPPLLATGVHGVAMSSALINVPDPQGIVHQIQKALC